MKYFASVLLLASSAVLLGSCKDSKLDPAPSYTSVGLVKATVDPDFSLFSLSRARASLNTIPNNADRPIFKFTVDLYDQRDLKITKVYVYKTLRRGSAYSNRALAAEVTTFPTTLSFDTQTTLTGLFRIGTTPSVVTPDSTYVNAFTLIPFVPVSPSSPNTVFTGDAIVFTYEYDVETSTGTERIVLTPTNKINIIVPSVQTVEVVTGSQINEPFAVIALFK